ncbi:hypothetical protein ANCCAN_27905, partial [Ancylostoma caninum]
LPERSAVFGRRCSALARTHPKEFASVDIDRFVSTASNADLLSFLHLFSDVEVEICGSIWDKAAGLLASSMASNVNLRAFVVNQLAVGMRSRSPQSSSRFKSCVEKLMHNPILNSSSLFVTECCRDWKVNICLSSLNFFLFGYTQCWRILGLEV